ncbi:2-amino-4-hydroxy-6-hydroxymethyldihydropteridinediphosphokinase [Filibacter tadaridae]|uniref:2-amino-4-hydroxy-6-hydroxymethyldihydropteridine diphosphokinase n=1 Tax=Filibacter tadaridae TaxID=2483811 RepID=A0A3P5WVC3_9BACL|nr:2-amino-4-hydroxy-6-hydroxymethyldihydropteridine diphosphokinase [Filibacter tadaridae]VDC18866.1 2-amino-4-hydroxy-6-hydroxymethyldihydropteridinepyrophosphokinase [Filibacter tadaridae]
MNIGYISIGSNIEDRLYHLTEAVRALHLHDSVTVAAASSIYETVPVGYTEQADFLNMVVCVKTKLDAQELLEICQEIERGLGRIRDVRWGPRTADLDILLYNDDNIESETLTVPHPRMQERAFVLVPLLEMDSSIIHPVSKNLLSDEAAAKDKGVKLWKKINEVAYFVDNR